MKWTIVLAHVFMGLICLPCSETASTLRAKQGRVSKLQLAVSNVSASPSAAPSPAPAVAPAAATAVAPVATPSIELFFGAPYNDIDLDAFKTGLLDGFHALGVSQDVIDRLHVTLREGSTIATVSGSPADVSVVQSKPLGQLEVLGWPAKLSQEELAATAGEVAVPVVSHAKKAGSGYMAGSPLYGKQQAVDAIGGRSRGFTEALNATWPPQSPLDAQASLFKWSKEHPLQLFLVFFIQVLIACAIGWIYFKFIRIKSDRRGLQTSQNGQFNHGLFEVEGCCSNWICCMSWCCPALRWADTVSSPIVSLMSFWVALLILVVLSFWNPWTGGLLNLIILCIVVYMRQQLRKKFSMNTGASACALDCLTWCCCSPCALAQEARQVDLNGAKK